MAFFLFGESKTMDVNQMKLKKKEKSEEDLCFFFSIHFQIQFAQWMNECKEGEKFEKKKIVKS